MAVEEPPLLLAVQRIVRRIQIENDLPRGSRVQLNEQIDEQMPDRHRIVTDPVIARRFKRAQFQPIERRLARNWRAICAPRLELAGQYRHHRIVAQFVVIVEVLVAKCDPEHPLPDQGRDLVLDQFRSPLIAKAPRKPIDHSNRAIRGPQQQPSRIRRHQSAVKSGFHRAAFNNSKIKAFCATLCRHRGIPQIARKSLWHSNFR